MDNNTDWIDLSTRDLLIRLTAKVDSLGEDVRELTKRMSDIQTSSISDSKEIAVLKQQVAENTKLRDRITGVIVGLVAELIGMVILIIREVVK
jgi:hypothetical protein